MMISFNSSMSAICASWLSTSRRTKIFDARVITQVGCVFVIDPAAAKSQVFDPSALTVPGVQGSQVEAPDPENRPAVHFPGVVAPLKATNSPADVRMHDVDPSSET